MNSSDNLDHSKSSQSDSSVLAVESVLNASLNASLSASVELEVCPTQDQTEPPNVQSASNHQTDLLNLNDPTIAPQTSAPTIAPQTSAPTIAPQTSAPTIVSQTDLLNDPTSTIQTSDSTIAPQTDLLNDPTSTIQTDLFNDPTSTIQTSDPTSTIQTSDQEINATGDQEVDLKVDQEGDLKGEKDYGSSSGEIQSSESSDESSDEESSICQSEMELSDHGEDKKDVKLVLKTRNEVQELPPVEKINVEIPMQEPLICVGRIEKIIQDNLIIVAADNSGDYQVLDMDSVLLSKDKRPIGKIFEVFGRVSQPLYSIRINGKEEIEDLGLEVNTPVYYIQNLVQMVFTQPLKAQKGSDASNLHDEEIAANEVEFSDDEKEAEHKRLTKKRKIKSGDSVGKAIKPQFSAQNHESIYASNQSYNPQYPQYQQMQQMQPSNYNQYIQQYNQYQYQMMQSGYNYNYQASQYPFGLMQPAYPPAYQMGMSNNYLQQSSVYTPQNERNNLGNIGASTTANLGVNQDEEEVSLYDNIEKSFPQ